MASSKSKKKATKKKKPESVATLRKRMETAFGRGDVEKAANAGLAALEIEPDHRRTLSITAAALGHHARWTPGPTLRPLPEVMERATAHVGDDWELLLNLQFLYVDSEKLHDHDPARLALAEKAIESFFAAGGTFPPDNPWPWINTVNTYVGLHRLGDALDLAQKAVETHGQAVGYHSLASVHAHRRDREGAMKAIELAHESGYEAAATIRYDPEMAFLHGDAEFEALFPARRRFIEGFEACERTPPDTLLRLFELEERVGAESYAEGFVLSGADPHLDSYVGDEAARERLLSFAQADGTGSTYAFWLQTDERALDSTPIAIFGSEGGAHVVARGVADLLRLLSFDAEPSVDHESVRFARDSDERSPQHPAYVTWLQSTAGLSPIDDPAGIVVAAQRQWGGAFAEWWRESGGLD